MSKSHPYSAKITWTGNTGEGTANYAAYERNHTIEIEGKVALLASSDAPFRGDISKHNPEDLLLSSLSSCHMLWYLHLCADAKVIVLAYEDSATGTLVQDETGAGKFSEVILYPKVTVRDEAMVEKAWALHKEAHRYCFIANSVNFEVETEAEVSAVARKVMADRKVED